MSAARQQPTQTVSMGDASVEVRYDHQEAEPATRDYPGADEDLQITEVLIGNEWVGSEFFAEKWLQDAAVSVLEQVNEDARDAEAEAAERESDARRDDFRSYYP